MKKVLIIGLSFIVIIVVCFVLLMTPVGFVPPVLGATKYSYSQNDFLSPRDGHKHKGIDIFAPKGTPVIAASKGIVVYTGVWKLGGNVILVMDGQFKYHYYAHLSTIEAHKFQLVSMGEQIGKVGNTGNALHTPPHLHYSIANPMKVYTYEVKGVQYRLPYLNPVVLLNDYFKNLRS